MHPLLFLKVIFMRNGCEYPIITFDQIVDTEVGLIQTVNKKYHNEDAFYWSLMDAPVKVLLGILINRKRKNPLTVIAKERDDTELMDSYYNEFMEKEYVSILKNSIVTHMYYALQVFADTKGVKPQIYCKLDIEANFLRQLDRELFSNKCDIIVDSSYNKAITERNDIIYLKNFDEVINIFEKARFKHLYVASYRYNFEDDEKSMLLRNQLVLCKGNIDVKVYDPYTKEDVIIGD